MTLHTFYVALLAFVKNVLITA